MDGLYASQYAYQKRTCGSTPKFETWRHTLPKILAVDLDKPLYTPVAESL